MAEIFSPERSERICPFRGIRYNRGIIGDLAAVICPPYDIITPEQQKLYYEKSNYNAIRLELPLEQLGDDDTNNKYNRAAITFQQWLKQGVLQIDDSPAFYLHDHYFTYLGKERRRRGLIAWVKLEPWGTTIYPHEETFSKASDDRLQLMRACRANFSPLFSLYQDSEQKIASILAETSQVKPIIAISVSSPSMRRGQSEGEKHVVWAITDPSLVRQISRFLAVQPLYIADGHHRYEAALAYQQERAQCHSEPFPLVIASRSPDSEQSEEEGAAKQSLTSEEAFNYVMMELVEFSDIGLVVLPIHRLVRGIAPSALAKLESQLENFFTLDFVPLTEASVSHYGRSEAISKMMDKAALGILGLEPQSLLVLKQRQDVSTETMMPRNRSQAYKEFSVSLLNHIILDKMLELAQDSGDIVYTVDVNEAYQQIKEGKYQLVFLLNPPQPEMVKAIADVEDRMPSKSTYFYPKLPAGLIINSLD